MDLDLGFDRGDREIPLTLPDGRIVQNGAGDQMMVNLMPITHGAGKRHWRIWTAGLDGKDQKDPEAQVDRNIAADVELCVRLVSGWNLHLRDGTAWPCTEENRREFFAAYDDVADVICGHLLRELEALGKKKPA